MTTDATLTELDFIPGELVVSPDIADLLFREAHTVNTFQDTIVPDEQVQAAYDLLRWGPTAMNTSPLRLLLVRTPQARASLAAHLSEGNRARVLAAPLTIVAAADTNFHEHLGVLVHRARDRVEQQVAAPDQRDAGLIAGRLDAEDEGSRHGS